MLKSKNNGLKILLFFLISIFIIGNLTLAFTYYEDETSDLFHYFLLFTRLEKPFQVPTDWAPINTTTCSINAQLAIKLNNLTEIKICDEEKLYDWNGKEVSYVRVEYGPGMDCPSGCIFQQINGIIEDGEYYDILFDSRIFRFMEPPYKECEPTIFPIKYNNTYRWGAIYNKTQGMSLKAGAYWENIALENITC